MLTLEEILSTVSMEELTAAVAKCVRYGGNPNRLYLGCPKLRDKGENVIRVLGYDLKVAVRSDLGCLALICEEHDAPRSGEEDGDEK